MCSNKSKQTGSCLKTGQPGKKPGVFDFPQLFRSSAPAYTSQPPISAMATTAGEAIENLWLEVRDLSLGTTTTQVDHLLSPPTPLQFLRDYVCPNKPCLISNATSHWPALSLWSSPSYLLNTLSSSSVSLHLTPTGRADSLAAHINPTSPSASSLCFASAHVEKVPFSTALSMIRSCGDTGSKCIAYLQEQNDCFRNEYSALSQDCDSHIPWASEALGCLPEAVNLWIGNDKSVTSFHKDHYENIYAVVTGEKHFLLLPPTDFHRMYIREYPAAQYHYSQVHSHCKCLSMWLILAFTLLLVYQLHYYIVMIYRNMWTNMLYCYGGSN